MKAICSRLSAGPVSAQADLGKTILEKLTAKVAKLESACANDIKKYCKTVTPGEGRLIYCMQAHEDKISVKCAFELGEAATSGSLRFWTPVAWPVRSAAAPKNAAQPTMATTVRIVRDMRGVRGMTRQR